MFPARARKAHQLSDNVELCSVYAFFGLSDREIIENPAYHDVIEGFKFRKLELELFLRMFRARDQDRYDIADIEAYAAASPEWDWKLVAELNRRAAHGRSRLTVRNIARLGRKAAQRASARMRVLVPSLVRSAVGTDRRAKASFANSVLRSTDIGALLASQFEGSRFKRYDILTRLAALRSIDAGVPDGIAEYDRMQRLRASLQSRSGFVGLLKNMRERGFFRPLPAACFARRPDHRRCASTGCRAPPRNRATSRPLRPTERRRFRSRLVCGEWFCSGISRRSGC
ncbi:hypothetical protein BH09PSE4_BH09PSE4_15900 [soil metagenome]